MSHQITSTDGLVLAREGAWHGLGQVLPQAPTVREAFRLAGLGWRVERHPIRLDPELVVPADRSPSEVVDGPMSTAGELIPDKVALVRSDVRDVFNVVGAGYEVMQNDDLADLIEGLSASKAVQPAESVGSLRGGRTVFSLVPRGDFTAGGTDLVRSYVLFANTHDGSGSLSILPTDVRVVCANTLGAALSGYRIRHTASLKERVTEAVVALRKLDAQQEDFRERVRHLAVTPMDDEDRRVFFLKVYERAFGEIPGSPTTKTERAAVERATETVSQWVANLQSARNTGTGTEGSVWHALNAVTEWSDHTRRVRDDDRSARVYSNLLGVSAGFKAHALQLAMQAAG